MIPAHILLTTEGASLLLLMLKDDQSATRNKEKSTRALGEIDLSCMPS